MFVARMRDLNGMLLLASGVRRKWDILDHGVGPVLIVDAIMKVGN